MLTKDVPVVCLCGECDNDKKLEAVRPEGCRMWCRLGTGHEGACGYFPDFKPENIEPVSL